MPTILLDMFVEGLPYTVIKTDNIEAGRLATAHLLGLGHRRIGIIAGIAGLATSDDRLGGYLKAHAEHGVPVEPGLPGRRQFRPGQAHRRAIELLQRRDRPTALIAISNMMTLGVLFAVRELKIKVPAELSILGIDDLDFAAVLDPAPTVVATPILFMARRAVEMLLTEITQKASRHGGMGDPPAAPGHPRVDPGPGLSLGRGGRNGGLRSRPYGGTRPETMRPGRRPQAFRSSHRKEKSAPQSRRTTAAARERRMPGRKAEAVLSRTR